MNVIRNWVLAQLAVFVFCPPRKKNELIMLWSSFAIAAILVGGLISVSVLFALAFSGVVLFLLYLLWIVCRHGGQVYCERCGGRFIGMKQIIHPLTRNVMVLCSGCQKSIEEALIF